MLKKYKIKKPLPMWNLKSQAALEFLTTYGWAFLVILIMIAALSYFGILSPSKLLPDRCNFGAEFGCSDYGIGSSGFLVKLRNNLGTPIIVDSLSVSTEKSQLACNSSVSGAIWAGGETKAIPITCDFTNSGIVQGDKGKLNLKMAYHNAKSSAAFGKEVQGELYSNVKSTSGITIGKSCKDALRNGVTISGVYMINPGTADISVYCDMTRDGGGWTMILKSWYQAGVMGNVNAVGTVADAMTRKGNAYKLSDADIRAIIGSNQKFDILADQNGYNSAYSTGNYEYVILRGYTGYWRFDTIVVASTTTTTFQSYRLLDNALAWTGNLECGVAGGAGINCVNVLANNPQGGAGCNINMGIASNSGWHHFYMSETNQDTYLYICNGPQHSSSHDMNHRWWLREA